MNDLFMKADDHETMLRALYAAGLAVGDTEKDDDENDVLIVESVKPIQASHKHALVYPVTVVATPAVIGEDGEVETPAVLAEGVHANLRYRGDTSEIVAALTGAGVEFPTPETPQVVW